MNIEYIYIEKYWEFLFKKIRASTFSGFRRFLSLVTVKPAVEKSLSLGVDVAGMQRIDLATLARWGKRNSFCSHQCSGWQSRAATLSVKYWASSS